MIVAVMTQKITYKDDAECWEERGDKCCYDFSSFNGQTLNSVGRCLVLVLVFGGEVGGGVDQPSTDKLSIPLEGDCDAAQSCL